MLELPGLTRGRFIALAVLSLLATSVVIAAGLRHDGTPYGLLAAAYSRQPATVQVAQAPAAPTVTPPDAAAAASTAPTAGSSPAADPVVDDAFPDPAPAPAPTGTSPSPTAPATPPATPPAKPASKIKHVFVISLAGSDRDATWGDASSATYLNGTLEPQGVLLNGYRALPEGGLATLIALTSGNAPTPEIQAGCPKYGSGCVFGIETLSVADQLVAKGLRWRAYAEDLGNGPEAAKACRHPANDAEDTTRVGRAGDEYATRLNPFVYFRSLTELGGCLENDLPLDALPEDLRTESATPNLSFIAPNLCNGGWEDPCADGNPGGLGPADAFLAKWVPAILDSPAYKKDGLLLIHTGSGLLVLSPFMPKGAVDETQVDAYSGLRYIEDLFGLDYLGKAANATPLTLAVPLR